MAQLSPPWHRTMKPKKPWAAPKATSAKSSVNNSHASQAQPASGMPHSRSAISSDAMPVTITTNVSTAIRRRVMRAGVSKTENGGITTAGSETDDVEDGPEQEQEQRPHDEDAEHRPLVEGAPGLVRDVGQGPQIQRLRAHDRLLEMRCGLQRDLTDR